GYRPLKNEREVVTDRLVRIKAHLRPVISQATRHVSVRKLIERVRIERRHDIVGLSGQDAIALLLGFNVDVEELWLEDIAGRQRVSAAQVEINLAVNLPVPNLRPYNINAQICVSW